MQTILLGVWAAAMVAVGAVWILVGWDQATRPFNPTSGPAAPSFTSTLTVRLLGNGTCGALVGFGIGLIGRAYLKAFRPIQQATTAKPEAKGGSLLDALLLVAIAMIPGALGCVLLGHAFSELDFKRHFPDLLQDQLSPEKDLWFQIYIGGGLLCASFVFLFALAAWYRTKRSPVEIATDQLAGQIHAPQEPSG